MSEHDKTERPIRCAIYCRKSSEEGLDSEFNSLDAQREAGENYIASQKAERWVCLPERYEDGGFSGGNLERPALKKLLVDIRAGKIDIVLVYKIDRLSRSLLDFAELIDTFDKHNVTFVSVTQQFSTTTSMGRLTLNILLSFAQFEREIIGERIRDKIAMQKQRGMQTGGTPVLGYNLVDGKLVINKDEAETVKSIFSRFIELESTTKLAQELRAQGITSKAWTTAKGKTRQGTPINKSHIYRMLNNPKYLGKVEHKEKLYNGEHPALIDQETWDAVHAILERNTRTRATETRFTTPAMLKGIIRCGHCGCSMRPGWTKKNGRKYRYYVCINMDKHPKDVCPVRRISAAEAEDAVMRQLRIILQRPEIVAHTARAEAIVEANLTEGDIRHYLRNVDAVWEYL
ncbi:MAG: recombinase family protein, partial [Bacteroidetes bacterium]|nr:recombinase family protein [Bacteroidota bacterium]